MDQTEIRKRLSPQAFHVTQEKGTESAFSGMYHDNRENGMYHCVVCGEPLFSSDTKFDSGTGWPSFTAPLADSAVATASDISLGMERTEVLCKKCGAHLGHMFPDGPLTKPDGSPDTGLRYCINSCALDFDAQHSSER